MISIFNNNFQYIIESLGGVWGSGGGGALNRSSGFIYTLIYRIRVYTLSGYRLLWTLSRNQELLDDSALDTSTEEDAEGMEEGEVEYLGTEDAEREVLERMERLREKRMKRSSKYLTFLSIQFSSKTKKFEI